MIYFDFDGVILDTEELLFLEWRRNPNRDLLDESIKIQYIKDADWKYIINNSEIINDAINYLLEIDPNNSFILTKIHSIENEGIAKINWLKERGIKQGIILVPYNCSKAKLVQANNNILVDDCLANLDEWKKCGGIPILFDINDDNYDSWQVENTKGYQKIKDFKMFT